MYRDALVDYQSVDLFADVSSATLVELEQVATSNDLNLVERLSSLRRWMQTDLSDLEAQVEQVLNEARTSSDRSSRHILDLRGKRLRAICVMLASRITGHSNPEATVQLAIAIELIHASTLLHDDVIDDSDSRRGAPSAHTVYGNSVSILAGDQVLVEALSMIQSVGDAAIMTDMLLSLRKIVHSEAIQLDQRGKYQPDRSVYMQIAEGKTATLFAWAFKAGAIAGGGDAATCQLLTEVGHQLGVGFQVIDDVIDLESSPEEAGKDTLNDIREGKFTLPLIIAAERHPSFVDEFREAADVGTMDRVTRLVQNVVKVGAVAEARRFAIEASESAVEKLFELPTSSAREHLIGLVRAATSRSF